jgi:hypothetical protein
MQKDSPLRGSVSGGDVLRKRRNEKGRLFGAAVSIEEILLKVEIRLYHAQIQDCFFPP